MDVHGVTGLNNLHNTDKLDNKKSKKTNQSKKNEIADNVVISEQAKKAAKENSYLKMIKELPEDRKELIEKAKDDISSGALLSPNIIEKTAEKIIQGISDTE